MNIFVAINSLLGFYINLFWISFPLTIYLALEINQFVKGETFITTKVCKWFKERGEKK